MVGAALTFKDGCDLVDSIHDIRELESAISNLVGRFNNTSFGCDIWKVQIRVGYLKFFVFEYDEPKEYEYNSLKMIRAIKIRQIFE